MWGSDSSRPVIGIVIVGILVEINEHIEVGVVLVGIAACISRRRRSESALRRCIRRQWSSARGWRRRDVALLHKVEIAIEHRGQGRLRSEWARLLLIFATPTGQCDGH